MEKQIIARGLLAGALAGVLAFVFARIFVEPVIGQAIDYEDGRGDDEAAMGAHEHGVEAVHPRRAGQHRHGLRRAGVQRRDGRAVRGRVRASPTAASAPRRPRALSLLLAGGMFVALYLVPFLKYPANPPRSASRRPSAAHRCCTC